MRKVANAAERLAYPIDGDFYDLLRWHLFTHGTRPDGRPDQIGKKVWSPKQLAEALQLHQRTVSNWLREENPTPPQDLASVERVIFGENRLYDEWQASLRTAYNALRDRAKQESDTRTQDHRAASSSLPNFGIARSFHRTTRAFLEEYLVSETGEVPFGGRDVELKRLADWLFDSRAASRMLITAPAGRGKSVLLVHWMKSLLDYPRFIEEGWQLAFVPISIRVGTNRPSIFYGGLAHRLAEITGASIAPEAVQNVEALKQFVEDQLEASASAGQRLIVVLDGLDEALLGSFDPSIIPRRLPANLRIVLSARWQVGDTDSTGWLRKLGWDRNVRAEQMELERLPRDAIADVLLKLGAPTDVLAQERKIIDRLCELTEGEPILVRYYAEDLWQLGLKRARITTDDLDSLKPGFGSYFERWLAHQERLWAEEGQNIDRLDVDRVLSILAFAFGPLESRDLLDLMREIHQTTDILSEHDLLQPLRRFIIGNGRTDSGYVLSHPKIAGYLRRERFDGRANAMGTGFATWGQKHLRKLNSGEIKSKDASPYALQFLKGHFEDAGLSAHEWMELVEDGWRRAWERFDGVPWGFASDVQAAWNVVRSLDETNGIGAQWRCALVLSSIRSIGLNVPDELLCAAVTHERLSIRQAVRLVEVGRSDFYAVLQLLRLARLDALTPAQSNSVIATSLEQALSIRNDAFRAQALGWIAPHLAPEQRVQILAEAIAAVKAVNYERSYVEQSFVHLPPEQHAEVAEAFRSEHARMDALKALAPHLALEQMGDALAAAMTISREGFRAEVLKSLAPYLTPEQMAEALAAAKAIGNAWARVSALGSLFPHLAPEQKVEAVAEAVATAKTIGAAPARSETMGSIPLPHAHALGSFASCLAPEQIGEALAAAKEIGAAGARAWALGSLVPYLTLEPRAEALAEALAAARTSGDEWARAEALGWLAPHLAPEQMGEAFTAAKAIRHQIYRVNTLRWLTPHLAPQQIAEVLTAAKAIGDKFTRSYLLRSLAPHLAPEQMAEALAAAKAIGDDLIRVETLASLALHLAAEQKADALAEALAVAKAIGAGWGRANVWRSLGRHLAPEQIVEALASAKAIGAGEVRAHALASLAPYLKPQQIDEALAAAKAIGVEPSRVQALLSLAPHLAPDQKADTLAEALVAAKAIGDEQSRALMLVSLVPHLTPEQKAEALAEALAAARAVDVVPSRVQALIALVRHLAPEQKGGILVEALAAAEAIRDERSRAQALGSLAPHLEPERITEALAAVRAIKSEGLRIPALASLARHLAPEQKAGVLAEALAVAKAIGEEQSRAHALGWLAPLMVPVQVADALAAAKAIGNVGPRANALGWLLPYLAPEQKAQALAEALAAAKAIGDADSRALTVEQIAPHLAPEQMADALAAAKTIGDARPRAKALGSLLSYLPPEEKAGVLPDALAAAKAIRDDHSRAQALGRLASHLVPEQMADALAAAKAIGDEWARVRALGWLASHVSPNQYARLITSLVEAAARLPRSAVFGTANSGWATALSVITTSRISVALGGVETLEMIRRAINDTARWYP